MTTADIPDDLPIPHGKLGSSDYFFLAGRRSDKTYYTFNYFENGIGKNFSPGGYMASMGIYPEAVQIGSFSQKIYSVAFTLTEAGEFDPTFLFYDQSSDSFLTSSAMTRKLRISSDGKITFNPATTSTPYVSLTPQDDSLKKNELYSGKYYNINTKDGNEVLFPALVKYTPDAKNFCGVNMLQSPENIKLDLFLIPYTTAMSIYNAGSCKKVSTKQAVYKNFTDYLGPNATTAGNNLLASKNCDTLDNTSENCAVMGTTCTVTPPPPPPPPGGSDTADDAAKQKMIIIMVGMGMFFMMMMLMMVVVLKK